MPYTSHIENFATESNLPIMAGTLIDTECGRKPVEVLEIGDLFRAKDTGLQPIRWIAARRLDRATRI